MTATADLSPDMIRRHPGAEASRFNARISPFIRPATEGMLRYDRAEPPRPHVLFHEVGMAGALLELTENPAAPEAYGFGSGE
jgi:hypothetical protein